MGGFYPKEIAECPFTSSSSFYLSFPVICFTYYKLKFLRSQTHGAGNKGWVHESGVGGYAFWFFGMMGTQDRSVSGVLGYVEAGNPFKNRHGLAPYVNINLVLKGLA